MIPTAAAARPRRPGHSSSAINAVAPSRPTNAARLTNCPTDHDIVLPSATTSSAPQVTAAASAHSPATRSPRRFAVIAAAPSTTSKSQTERVSRFDRSSSRRAGSAPTRCSAPTATTWKSGGVAYS